MLLSRIEISGFKTFAERTQLAIRSGVTVIVGPNGSGKSNIIDAIRWAMGEQSMHSLRSTAPDELIFNGSSQRDPLQMAEVSLIFDNRDNTLPLAHDEVSVTKRLYRSREQEYLLNNVPSKLKDIRSLFLGTGIGHAPYSVLEQGRADSLLSKKMDERRAIFEEIANIRGYRLRYAEAERRLSTAVNKMQQLEPLVREIQSQHIKLKKQAQELNEYRQLKEKLRVTQMKRVVGHYRALDAQQESSRKRLHLARGRHAEIQSQYQTLVAARQQAEEQLNTFREQLTREREKLHANELRQERETNVAQNVAQQQHTIDEQIAHESHLLERDQRRIANLRQEEGNAHRAEEKATQQVADLLQQLEALTASIQQYRAHSQQKRVAAGALQKKLHTTEKQREQLWVRIRELSQQIVETLEQLMHPQKGSATIVSSRLVEEIDNLLNQISTRLDQQSHRVDDPTFAELIGQGEVGRILEEHQRVVGALHQDHTQLIKKIQRYRSLVDPLIALLTNPQGDFAQRHILDREYQQLRHQIEGIQEQIQSTEEEIDATQTTIDQLRTQEAQIQVALERHRSQATLHKQNSDRLAREIEELTQSRNQVHDRISAHRHAKQELSTEHHDSRAALTQLNRQHTELSHTLVVVQKESDKLERAIMQMKERMSNKERMLAVSSNKVEKATEAYHRAEVRVTETKEQFLERYGEDIDVFGAQFSEEHSRRPSDKEMERIREKLQGLGKINMMAQIEFEELDARYQLLNTQMEDLNKARVDLKQVTTHIIEQSGQSLTGTIEGINSHFNSVFRDLFRGGNARIYLTNPHVPLESPIHIEAHPPGKRPVHIEQLSGGERSLAGLALLFAFFRQHPTPLALMDEVDATLDENNVTNFGTHILKYGKQTQFVIISHNPRTIACAETLIGVTMQEEGVSTVVELDTKKYL